MLTKTDMEGLRALYAFARKFVVDPEDEDLDADVTTEEIALETALDFCQKKRRKYPILGRIEDELRRTEKGRIFPQQLQGTAEEWVREELDSPRFPFTEMEGLVLSLLTFRSLPASEVASAVRIIGGWEEGLKEKIQVALDALEGLGLIQADKSRGWVVWQTTPKYAFDTRNPRM